MSKSTNKKNKFNVYIIERLMQKYAVSKRFVTMSLTGDRTSDTAELIKKEYEKLEREIEIIINK